MKFEAKFVENNQKFVANFGEFQNISDGGYERGYAEGYEDGVESVPDGIEQLITNKVTEYSNENITSTVGGAFQNCTNLEKIHLPLLTRIEGNTFDGCSGLLSVNFPNVQTIFGYAFRNCTNLKIANFPKVNYAQAASFQGCTSLTVVDFPTLAQIGVQAFDKCASLTAFVLRAPKVCNLQNVNSLGNTPIANGTGYIYVPANLVEQYKTATNWSTYANQIRAIEDYPEICN